MIRLESIKTLAPPRSRRDRRKRETRGRIYAAAMRLFLERGFEAVTVEEICAAADVARATFFLHFPTKDSLLVEYGRQALDDLSALFARGGSSALETLEAGLRLLAERASRHADVVRLVVRETERRPGAIAANRDAGAELSELFASVVRRGKRSGEFRRDVSASMAGAILATSYLAIAGEWARLDPPPDLSSLTRQALDVLLLGLRPAPTERSRRRGARRPGPS